MITIEDQRIVATKLTVRERVLDNHALSRVSAFFVGILLN